VILGPAIVAALLLRTLVAEPFVVPTGSMLPTLQIGDHVYASKLDSGLPERGEIAVFRLPSDENRRLIKRVVGLPGDVIEMRSGRLLVNGDEVPRCDVGEVAYMDRDLTTLTWREERGILHVERLGSAVYTVVQAPRIRAPDFGPAIVPAGQVFMMGDNRDHSWDSRSWGAVPVSNILGHARLIWWSSGPRDEPLRLQRMGHVLGSPAEYGELIGPCLQRLAREE
jgi:signal peptidase I